MLKNTLLRIVFFLLFPLCSSAMNYLVSGSDVSVLNGLYRESSTYNGKPFYINTSIPENNYLYYDGNNWQISRGSFLDPENYYTNTSTATIPPQNGWTNALITSGHSIPLVRQAPATLTYSRNVFVEDRTNNGSTKDTIKITYDNSNGDIFSGDTGDDLTANGNVQVANVPAGMSAQVILMNDSVAAFFLNGKTNNHININDINNLHIRFLPQAFAGNDTVGLTGAYRKDLDINFREAFTVGTSGTADYTTVKEAVTGVTWYDILLLGAETFTEVDIQVDKPLVFVGKGANSTIVQAHEEKNTASGRVFSIVIPISSDYYETVFFEQMTIRHGNVTGANAYGGGIDCMHLLEIHACVVRDNSVTGQGEIEALGGGIHATYIKMFDCLIADNYVSNETQTGRLSGGGMFSAAAWIVNSTFSGNYSASEGGGYAFSGYANLLPAETTLINCTIANNVAKTSGGGMHAAGRAFLINTIISGNQAAEVNAADLSNVYGEIYASNSIIPKAARLDYYSNTVPVYKTAINVYTTDPMLGVLADNGGATLTYALLPGSPAIDAGISGVNVPSSDQRGYAVSGQRDIGAFEFTGITTATVSKHTSGALIVYPNPSKGVFHIPDVTGSVVVSNVLGKQVTQKAAEQDMLDLTDLPAGMYMLTVTTSTATQNTVKVIIE